MASVDGVDRGCRGKRGKLAGELVKGQFWSECGAVVGGHPRELIKDTYSNIIVHVLMRIVIVGATVEGCIQ